MIEPLAGVTILVPVWLGGSAWCLFEVSWSAPSAAFARRIGMFVPSGARDVDRAAIARRLERLDASLRGRPVARVLPARVGP